MTNFVGAGIWKYDGGEVSMSSKHLIVKQLQFSCSHGIGWHLQCFAKSDSCWSQLFPGFTRGPKCTRCLSHFSSAPLGAGLPVIEASFDRDCVCLPPDMYLVEADLNQPCDLISWLDSKFVITADRPRSGCSQQSCPAHLTGVPGWGPSW